MDKVNSVYGWIDNKLGLNKKAKACETEKEMLFECIFGSECFQDCQDFKFCMQDGINKDCKALRYDLFLCRRSQLFWQKSLRDEPR